MEKAENPPWADFKSGDDSNFIVKKAGKIRSAYPKNSKKEIKALSDQKIYYKDTATIVIGSGCGHLVNSIIKGMDKGHRVVVVEPFPFFVKKTLSNYDFSKAIEKTELIFVSNEDEISLAISMCSEVLVVQDWLLIVESYVLMCEEYSDIMTYTNQIVDQMRCNIGTVAGAGSVIAENDIKNLPYIIKHRGVKDLKNIYKNKPAILVATGPAIDNNIHMLKNLQDTAVIISIAQGLRMLLAYDIKPDFITTVDYGEINYEHFRGLMDEDIPLVALNRTYAPILKHYQGPKFIAGTHMPGFEKTATGIIQDKGYLESGGSVTHLSYQLAEHMGCNPIILVGHGFSAETGKSHTNQVDAGGVVEIEGEAINWTVTDPRSKLHQVKQYQGAPVYLPGIFGQSCPLNIGLASFVTTFEAMFKKSKALVINASEEGTAMKGVKNMTLEKAVDLHLYKEIDKSKITSLLSPDPHYKEDIDTISDRLIDDIENLKEIIFNSQEGLHYADQMIEYRDDKKLFKEMTEANTKYSDAARDAAKKNPLVAIDIYGVNRKIHSRELKVKGRGKDLLKNLDTRVKRNKMILKAAKESAERLLPIYYEVGNMFDKIHAAASLNSYRFNGTTWKKIVLPFEKKVEEDISLKDVKKYFEVGNWSHPLVDARKIIASSKHNLWTDFKRKFGLFEYKVLRKAEAMKEADIKQAIIKAVKERRQDKIDYHQLVKDAHKHGKEEKKFGTALTTLKKAINIFPEKIEARWGYASTLLILKRTEEALEKYKGLVRDFPENHRMCFEYGIALLSNEQIEEGMDVIIQAMAMSEEYNHFYKNLGELYLLQEKKDLAKKAYKEYLIHFPDDQEAKIRLKKI